jgi:energy-coupling factor transport system ATP-binding protein
VSGTIITLENVSWTYSRAQEYSRVRECALNNISVAIEEGECIAVMGENGAGKTSFCRLINGLIPHSLPGKLTGAVTVDGIVTSSSSVPQLARKVGMAFEDAESQLFTARVDDEIAFALENLLQPPDEIREKVNWALNISGLSAFADRAPSTLSGGQKQRLVIAAALAMAARILVLDEATSQLDPPGAREILSLIRELRVTRRLTVVMATNSGEEAAEFADKILVLKNGSLAAYDTPQRIFVGNGEWGVGSREEKCNTNCIAKCYTEFSTNCNTLCNTNSNTECITPNAIQVNNLCFQYDSGGMILDDVNFAVRENEFVVISGRNGCGKTSLLKNISGLLRPARGSILLRGRDTAGMDIAEIAREIGFVMQDPDPQLFTSTVYDEAAFALKRLLPQKEVQQKVEEALSMVGLLDKRDAFPPALNRADRVKTVFAAILAMGPKIIMLDEPFAGQDMRGCNLIADILVKLHRQGYTAIVVTHNINVIESEMQRHIIMRHEE